MPETMNLALSAVAVVLAALAALDSAELLDGTDPVDRRGDGLVGADLTGADALGDPGRVVGAKRVVGNGVDPLLHLRHGGTLPGGSHGRGRAQRPERLNFSKLRLAVGPRWPW